MRWRQPRISRRKPQERGPGAVYRAEDVYTTAHRGATHSSGERPWCGQKGQAAEASWGTRHREHAHYSKKTRQEAKKNSTGHICRELLNLRVTGLERTLRKHRRKTGLAVLGSFIS